MDTNLQAVPPPPRSPGDELILAADQMRNYGFLLLHVAHRRSTTLHASAKLLMADLGVPEALQDEAASRLVLRVTNLKEIFPQGRN